MGNGHDDVHGGRRGKLTSSAAAEHLIEIHFEMNPRDPEYDAKVHLAIDQARYLVGVLVFDHFRFTLFIFLLFWFCRQCDGTEVRQRRCSSR